MLFRKMPTKQQSQLATPGEPICLAVFQDGILVAVVARSVHQLNKKKAQI